MPMSQEPWTLFWPRTGARPALSRPIWFVTQAMAAMVCTVFTPWRCWVTPMPQPIMELGAVAYMRAALRISSGLQPQMSATDSGV